MAEDESPEEIPAEDLKMAAKLDAAVEVLLVEKVLGGQS